MPADLHRDPDALDRIARALTDLADAVHGAVRSGPAGSTGVEVAVLAARRADEISAAAGRIAGELDAVAAAAARAAGSARAAEADASAALRSAGPVVPAAHRPGAAR